MTVMRSVNLSSVDLNLLHVLATVLEEGSATRAAQRLHVTQSAVSNALGRARALFDDPLVVRRPHGLAPTSLAAALLPELRAWLEEARRLVGGASSFEPATTTRAFRIACSDAVTITLLPSILEAVARRAPHAHLHLVTLEELVASDGLARGEVDLLVGIPPVLTPTLRAEPVFVDPMACVVRRERGAPKRLSLSAYTSRPHVELTIFGVDQRVDRALATVGRARTIQVVVPHFSAIPLVVSSSSCIATVSLRLARAFAARWPLVVLSPPITLPPLEIRQVWHARAERDPAIAFLREIVRDAALATTPR